MSSPVEADDYEHYNYDQDKYANQGHSGKQRTKKEVSEHTNHHDPNGHSRKILTKLQNTEKNAQKKERKDSKWDLKVYFVNVFVVPSYY